MSGPPSVVEVDNAEEFSYSRRLTCPVCSYEHLDNPQDEYTGAAEPRHRCSHQAYMLFAANDCPICHEEQTGPPTVALSCGHIVCPTDFRRLGGRIGAEASSSTTNRNGRSASESRRQREEMPFPVGGYASGISPFADFHSLPGPLRDLAMFRNTFFSPAEFGSDSEEYENQELFGDDSEDDESEDSLPELIDPRRELDANNSATNRPAASPNSRQRQRRGVTAAGPLRTSQTSDSDDDDSSNDVPPLEVRGGGGQGRNGRNGSDNVPELANGPQGDGSSSSSEDSMPELANGPQDDTSSSSGDSIPGLASGQRSDSSSSSDSPPPLLTRRTGVNQDNDGPEGRANDGNSDDESDVPSLMSRPDSSDEDSQHSNDAPASGNVPATIERRNVSSDDDSLASGVLDLLGTAGVVPSDSESDDDRVPALVTRTHDLPSLSDDEATIAALASHRTNDAEHNARAEREEKRKSDAVTLLATQFRRHSSRQRFHRFRRSALQIQAWGRWLLVQQKWCHILRERVAAHHRFDEIWGPVLESAKGGVSSTELTRESSWETIKAKRFDMLRTLVDQASDTDISSSLEGTTVDGVGEGTMEITEATERLDSAVQTALALANGEDEIDRDDEANGAKVTSNEANEARLEDADESEDTFSETLQLASRPKCDHIQLTKDVLRWLDRQDAKYRGFFFRRIRQLADGERSRILKKNLTGAHNTTIWETYLDQKSGQRILWTEYKYSEEKQHANEMVASATKNNQCLKSVDHQRGLLIWYVAKHDNVSRLIKLIDDAERRSRRKGTISASMLFADGNDVDHPTSIECDGDVMTLDDSPHRIMADPLGDTPLKVHLLHRDDLSKFETIPTWKPPLHLTREERSCVEKEGTVLLLGRSGTGKTICICNRMDYDRRLWSANVESEATDDTGGHNLSQLFVARSHRICSYVRGIVDGPTNVPKRTTYTTFSTLLRKCESTLSVAGNLDSSRYVNFGHFKRHVYKSDLGLDVLVIWSQIRSFIKGSMEAVLAGRPLTEEEYMGLGVNRCRLSPEDRKSAYAAYKYYQAYLDQERLWDDCDRVSRLVEKLRSADYETRQALAFHKVYVDEIQDYTQAEIAIFFMMCNRGGLFLAGDTAQSVVEGVSFRFEEVRSVGHALFQGDSRYIPDKPVTVNTNFRSHAGILNTAAAILERMFEVFPRSANRLKPDVGVFLGPRPGIFQNLSLDRLRDLVSRIDGVVLLTHDGHVEELQRIVGDTVIVLGIRESKGLEFPNVIIVDFFRLLEDEHQKPWRELLTIREQRSNSRDGIKKAVPEVETQLKLIYTAITRCSKRLFFAETKPSIAGSAFVKWATYVKKEESSASLGALAVKQVVDDVEKMVKTLDEWRSSGVDFAMEAEACSDDPGTARKWLVRAVHDLAKGDDAELKKKADVNLSSIDFRIELEAQYEEHRAAATVATSSGNCNIPSESIDHVERKASTVMGALLDEGLIKEARLLCNTFVPLLTDYSKNRFRENGGLLSLLPEHDV